ncbi:ribulose-phosphate 3-epimerase [Candidatus Peregrinibacteria bacterium]|nr:ribulose-phosphate 3-epimerase [Candidatus Peregrinibacteria bacterium]
MKIKIAPSILSADFGKLNEEIASIDKYVDLIHVDVMDGHFVPNLTIGAPVVKYIKSSHPLDVHLMIENPEKYIEDFLKAGSDRITVHIEACDDVEKVLKMIKNGGADPCICLKPGTPLSEIEHVLPLVKGVLVMTVEPGFGGQKFMEDMMPKVRELRAKWPEIDIEIDGGINAETSKIATEAGANILVSGSYIFKSEDRIKAIESLRG